MFVKDRISNDKVLVIKGPVDSIKEFENIGARVIRDELELHELYYNGSMIELTKIINDKQLKNYSIFDSTLDDKVKALQGGPLPKFVDNNYKTDYISNREYDEVDQIVVEPTNDETIVISNENTEVVDNSDDTILFNASEVASEENKETETTDLENSEDNALIKENNNFDENTFVNVSHLVENQLENDDTVIVETKEDK